MPFYILIDTSQFMVGEPISLVFKHINSFIKNIKQDPFALESFYFSIITFGNGHSKQLFTLNDLMTYPENWENEIQTSGKRVLGQALNLLETVFNKETIQNAIGVKRDFTATLIVFCSGESEDFSTVQKTFLQTKFHSIYNGLIHGDDERAEENGYYSRVLYCFNSKVGELHKELFPNYELIDINDFEKTQQSMLFHLKKFFIS